MASPARTYALVVGIAEYDAGAGWELYAPVADAARAVLWLLRRGVPPEQILLFLSPVPPDVTALLASVAEGPLPAGADRVQASLADHAGVDGAVRRTLKSVAGELLVVFWGGHGAVDQERQQRLFLADATLDDRRNVDLERLLLFLRSSYFAGFPQQLVCVDACASRFDDRSSEMRLPTDAFPDGKDVPGRKQILLRAASRGQVALESKRQKKGLFSRELLAQLDADTSEVWPPDMRAVATRLKTRFAELAQELPVEQLPTLWTYEDDDGTIRGSTGRTGRPGRDAARLVDRVVQTRAFQKFITPGISAPERRPHAIIIYGNRNEAHQSLVERVVTECLQKLVAPSGGGVLPPLQSLDWPSEGTDLEDRKDQLKEKLKRAGSSPEDNSDASAVGLLSDPSLQGHKLVVFHHAWTVASWTEVDERLLAWYLDEFWTALPADQQAPRPVIFLKMICADELSRVQLGSLLRLSLTPKHRLRASLERLTASAGASCRRIVLDELQPVPFSAVVTWFYDIAVAKWLSDAEANQAAERIFAGPGGRRYDCLPMSKIEQELADLIEPRTEQRVS